MKDQNEMKGTVRARRRRTPDEVLAILRASANMSDAAILDAYNITFTTLWRWRRRHAEVLGHAVTHRAAASGPKVSWTAADVRDVEILRTAKEPPPTRRVKKAFLRDQNRQLKRIILDQMRELNAMRRESQHEAHV